MNHIAFCERCGQGVISDIFPLICMNCLHADRFKAYASHQFEAKYQPGTANGPEEYHSICANCGMEDMGHPDEFDVSYPMCEDLEEE